MSSEIAENAMLRSDERTPADGPVASLVYRSRARRAFDGNTLGALLNTARVRNRAESLTGLLVYDEGTFLQWLEGPAEGLEKVADSIRKDPRHGDFEVLSEGMQPRRAFSGWDMKLATGLCGRALPPDTAMLPRALLDALEDRPRACGKLLPLLVDDDDAVRRLCGTPLVLGGEDLLRDAIDLVVRARLEDRFPGFSRLLEQDRVARSARELAQLMVEGKEERAHDLIVSSCGTGDPFTACAGLFEPACEALGDLWSADACSELDVTLSLVRLQTEFRRLSAEWPLPWDRRADGRSVLVCSVPGEWDCFGPVLAAEALWRSGYRVELSFPETEEALLDEVSRGAFDFVHISLSPVFRHEERLGPMGSIVSHLRDASRNHGVRVVVAGRIFREDAGARCAVGADLAVPTAATLDDTLCSCGTKRELVTA